MLSVQWSIVTCLNSKNVEMVRSGVKSLVSDRYKRRADKHLGAAPPSQLYNSAPPPSYPKKEEPVDLHNKEFCVDVSAFEPVVWKKETAEECDTTFVKKCEEREEQVCADVVETRCEVIPYTECSMGMVPQGLNRTKLVPKLFTEKVCKQGTKTVPHIKMVPDCKNVTKQNCVTNWETDAYGKQVEKAICF